MNSCIYISCHDCVLIGGPDHLVTTAMSLICIFSHEYLYVAFCVQPRHANDPTLPLLQRISMGLTVSSGKKMTQLEDLKDLKFFCAISYSYRAALRPTTFVF